MNGSSAAPGAAAPETARAAPPAPAPCLGREGPARRAALGAARLWRALLGAAVAASFALPAAADITEGEAPHAQPPLQGAYEATVVEAGPAPQRPKIPDLSGYTSEAVRAMVPKGKPGRVRMVSVAATDLLRKFTQPETYTQLQKGQGVRDPKAVMLEGGVFTLESLAAALDDPDVLERRGREYVLKRPLLIGERTTLVISGEETDWLKLDNVAGSFLISVGTLFIVDTRVTAWDDGLQAPPMPKDGAFQAFITAWSASETYVASSEISHLGSNASKAYGISLSAGPTKWKNEHIWPKGWFVDSRFHHMWYAFYSYEAEDVAIVNNWYHDNIIYGVDPHDRSRRLIIANNLAETTKKKHGIIISREVVNSWIVGNISEYNNNSGIMLDRMSDYNVVADNLSRHNGDDGISLLESSHNIIWNNTARDNQRDGLRIRNSLDIHVYGNRFIGNRDDGVEGYAVSI
ncbi:MAG TPA: NosD domain-containing protein, partial [Alphaproteobacteria bacterium]|nr:NosD domain-containing protein [Alphaproteobacteria bacterium]